MLTITDHRTHRIQKTANQNRYPQPQGAGPKALLVTGRVAGAASVAADDVSYVSGGFPGLVRLA